jgi:hypothetical protein
LAIDNLNMVDKLLVLEILASGDFVAINSFTSAQLEELLDSLCLHCASLINVVKHFTREYDAAVMQDVQVETELTELSDDYADCAQSALRLTIRLFSALSRDDYRVSPTKRTLLRAFVEDSSMYLL